MAEGTGAGMADGAELLARAKALAVQLKERGADINRARRVPADVIAMLWDADLFQLLRPRAAGGREVDWRTALAISRALAAGDGSVGWVWTVMTTHDFLVAQFPRRAREEYWSGRTLSAASFMPGGKVTAAEGGVRLSGRWSFCSGVDNADWMLLTANFRAGGLAGMPPDLRLLMVPIADIHITDDWDVIGLRGTGSKTVTVEDAFVPEHRIISFEDLGRGTGPGAADHGSAIYRAPLWAIFPFSIAATAPGMARGAVDTFVAEKAAAKVMETLPPGKRYSMQMRLAEASALTDSAELLLDRSLGETVALLEAGTAPTVQMRVRNRRDQAYAVTLAKRAGELLFGAEGSRGLYDGGHVQRAYRDLQAASVHVATNWESTATNYGQVTLGGQPIDPMY